jgi:outer membrane protein OmpA-like peptidoglycan-associated protein
MFRMLSLFFEPKIKNDVLRQTSLWFLASAAMRGLPFQFSTRDGFLTGGFMHFVSRSAVTIVALAALVGCTDFAPFTKEGMDLVGQYGPQITGFLKDNTGLMDRLKKIPAEFPGAADMIAKATANQGLLDGLKGKVDGLPGLIAAAVKAGKVEDVKAVISSFKTDIGGQITAVQGSMKQMTASVGELESAATAAAAAAAAVPAGAGAAAGEFMKSLAGGFSLKGNVNGIESNLVSFIEDASKPVDKTTWFDFDRLLFKTGSADLDMDKSKDQLVNVAEILKAYPKIELKVGGYTDNQGKADANKKLSDARAKAVAKALTGMGIDAKRLDPEGYGAEHPVCAANDTDACRAQNRRISVRVKAK